MDRDRNLLFGVFAVQLKQITPTQLVDAAGAWVTDPTRDLPERLVESGALSESDRKLIDDFVDRAVQAHGDDATRTLAAFGGEEQVDRSFRGGIVLTESGGVSRADERVTVLAETDLESVSAVQESPGRYTHISECGRGGMGRVLLVQDEHLGRDIALKELLPLPGTETDQPTPVRLSAPHMARFLQEARITGQLEHPSVVPVYELGHRKDGTLYYTMKLVRGQTLAKALRQCKDLKERLELLPHLVDLCQAIAYAHSRGVIHRDIKPGNVMVGAFGETVVLDWGLAKVRDKEDVHADGFAQTVLAVNVGDETDAAKTAYGQVLGTPSYMPPEQARGELDRVDERSDVYSLGAVLYETLTGQAPFDGHTIRELLDRVLNESPKAIGALESEAPAELVQICQRAMAKNPEERYRSAKELVQKLQNYTPRPFYLNPLRPSLTDLVPELAALPEAERRQVEKRARRRAWRDWRFSLAELALVCVSLFFTILCASAAIVPIHFAERIVLQREQIYTLERAYNTLAERSSEAAPVMHLTSGDEPNVWLKSIPWIRAYPHFFELFCAAMIFVFAYLFARFASEWHNQRRVPYVREVLAERERGAG